MFKAKFVIESLTLLQIWLQILSTISITRGRSKTYQDWIFLWQRWILSSVSAVTKFTHRIIKAARTCQQRQTCDWASWLSNEKEKQGKCVCVCVCVCKCMCARKREIESECVWKKEREKMCVCVCMYVYVCVCVCVCLKQSVCACMRERDNVWSRSWCAP